MGKSFWRSLTWSSGCPSEEFMPAMLTLTKCWRQPQMKTDTYRSSVCICCSSVVDVSRPQYKKQLTRCCSPIACDCGSFWSQSPGIKATQRGWNGHPDGRL